jgi:hypothetical protein
MGLFQSFTPSISRFSYKKWVPPRGGFKTTVVAHLFMRDSSTFPEGLKNFSKSRWLEKSPLGKLVGCEGATTCPSYVSKQTSPGESRPLLLPEGAAEFLTFETLLLDTPTQSLSETHLV